MIDVLFVAVASAGLLDLGTTSSTGCDPQWVGACLSADVWGPEDSLGVATPGTVPVLTMGSDAAVALEQGSFGTGDKVLNFVVKGHAHSSSTKVGVQIRFYSSSNALIDTHEVLLHAGAAGLFSVHEGYWAVPGNAAHWKARLLVKDDGAAIAEAGAACWGCGGGEWPPGTEDGGDTGGEGPSPEPECSDCSVDCGDFTATGKDCGEGCTATCDAFMDTSNLSFHPLVVL